MKTIVHKASQRKAGTAAPHAAKVGTTNIPKEPKASSHKDSKIKEDNQSNVLLTSGNLKYYFSSMKFHEFSNAQEITISAGSFEETIVP